MRADDPVRLARKAAWALPLFMLAWPGLLALARWPSYWAWIASEETPFTFAKTLLLFTCAGVALILPVVESGRPDALPPGAGHGRRRGWLVVAAGFLYLMCDDRFAIHERLRDRWLAHLGWGLPWGAPGDFVPVAYFLAGLALLPMLARLFRPHPAAWRLLLLAVGLAAVAFAADSVDPFSMTAAAERLEQTLEEVVKGVADALFAAAFLRALAESLSAALIRAASASRNDAIRDMPAPGPR